MLQNLPLQQNIFSFTYYQLDWGVGDIQVGIDFFKIFTNLGGGNKLKSEEKNQNLVINLPTIKEGRVLSLEKVFMIVIFYTQNLPPLVVQNPVYQFLGILTFPPIIQSPTSIWIPRVE